MTGEARPIGWVRAARKDFMTFPAAVRDRVGAALTIAAEYCSAINGRPPRGVAD